MSERFTAPHNDPWRGFRGVMAGTLILEVIVMLLTFPIVARLGGGLNWFSGGYLTVVTLVFILAAGMQGRPYALKMNLGLQALIIAGGFLHWSLAVIGVIFLFVWIYIRFVGHDVQRRMDEGRLPGQEPV